MNKFKLTLLQFGASRFLIINYINKTDCLIVAVCGAGKTEMCFPLFNRTYLNSKIAFAIPRIDICDDIFTRLCSEYGSDNVGLHTGQNQINLVANILVLTTNQLIKYKHYFDIIIIDEVDAFPFDNDPKFYEGAKRSKTSNGIACYLTSTPSDRLLANNFPTYNIYKRWHNKPLPIPKLVQLRSKHHLPLRIKCFIHNRPRQLLIFIATINSGNQFSKYLSKLGIEHHFIYSTHPERTTILNQFRVNDFDVLLTTTILERGVTFDDIDVLIIDSDNKFYNKAALVQIAGRARRKLDFQQGQVYFCYTHYTPTIKQSIEFIKSNNNQI